MSRRQQVRISMTIVAFFLFPAIFFYLSPYMIIDASLKGIISGSFLFFTLQFLSALVAGRAFCGWLCPGGGAQDIIAHVSKGRVTRFNIIKWILWTPWVAVIAGIAIRNDGYSKIEPTYATALGLSMPNVYSLFAYLSVLTLIAVPAFVVGRRSFCHHICWMAPFMILGRKISNVLHLPSLRLEAITDDCIHCHSCTDTCPMSLDVESMVETAGMENSECILCLTCVDGCGSNAIKVK